MSLDIKPRGDLYGAPKTSTTTAYASSRVVQSAPGTLYGLSGYNSAATVQFIQLHDAAALPADGAAPVVIILAPAASSFSIDFGIFGRYFANGIVVCNSSTGPTKTIGAADCWFDARFA